MQDCENGPSNYCDLAGYLNSFASYNSPIKKKKKKRIGAQK